MLEIKNIHKTFNEGTINEKKVFEGLSLTLEDGDFVTVIGGNGAGKSTMLNIVAGAYAVDEGEVIIDGVDVTNLPEYKRAKYIGRVFQDPRMGTASDMWVEENMSVADSRGHRRGMRWAIRGKDKEKYREQLKQLDLGLEDRKSAGVVIPWERSLLSKLTPSIPGIITSSTSPSYSSEEAKSNASFPLSTPSAA